MLLLTPGSRPVEAQTPTFWPDLYSQNGATSRLDLASQPESNDRIGSALASGDFNGDGYEDLVVGCADEDFDPLTDSGWVSVLYGSADGANGSNEDLWDQTGDVDGGEEAFDRVGFSAAVGDFNGDTFDDLVIGVPFEHVGDVPNNGAINVIYGFSDGLQLAGNLQLWQSREIDGHDVPGANEAEDRFGWSLAAGDFNGDNLDDLAIGVPYEHITSISDAGGVVVLYGKPVIGLDPEFGQYLARDASWAIEEPVAGDRYGLAVATGNFNADEFDDLVIGVPDDDAAGLNDVGAVEVIYGSLGRLDGDTNEVFFLGTPGVDGDPDSGDGLGGALAVGDFNGDGYDDVAAGLPGRDIEGAAGSNHGAALLIHGGPAGLDRDLSRLIWQGQDGLAGEPDADDRFGGALAAGDADGNGADDLLVGVSGELVVSGDFTRDGAGAGQLIFGSPGVGLVTSNSLTFDYNLVGPPTITDGLGSKVVLGDFDGDGRDDPAMAIPRREVRDPGNNVQSDAGEILVLHSGTLFRNGFESGTTEGWSGSVP